MKIRKKSGIALLVFCMLSSLLVGMGTAFGSSTDGKIIDVINRNHYLMEDGSIWTTSFDGPVHDTGSYKGIGGNPSSGEGLFAWTEDGNLANWNANSEHSIKLTKVSGIKKINGDIIINNDGTISGVVGKMKEIKDVIDADMYEEKVAVLLASGDIWFAENYTSKPRKIGHVEQAVEIKLGDVNTAVLKKNGTITLLDMLTDDAPREVGSNITSFVRDNKSNLIAIHQNGTVWSYSRQKKYVAEQISELSNIVKLVSSTNELFAQSKDGLWVGYDYQKGAITPLTPPKLSKLTLQPSSKEASIGSSIDLNVMETYSNGYELLRQPKDNELKIEKPEIAQWQANDPVKLLAKGMGSTTVSLETNGMSSSFTFNVSNNQKLTGAVLLDGVSYLPIEGVFKALGAVANVDKALIKIQLGETKIVLQIGSIVADIDGTKVTLKGKVQVKNGKILFPAALLTELKLGTFTWNAKLQQGELVIGNAKLVIQSEETAKIVKKSELGSLAKYIGKSYWVNNFYYGGERFSKVTIKDINVTISEQDQRTYEVIFQGAKGKIYEPYAVGTTSNVIDTLNDSNQLLTYDPYKKYKWSNAVWNKIKQNKVSFGMNTTQVQFAWGHPTSISKKSVKNKGTVEVWVYGNKNLDFKIVTFANGKVIQFTN
ncbi:hypothetical protein J2Z32_001467 [Paenibacillus turicensis]|uniref:Copper amine oxidase-like N-terminal domain-containing protein n=1 Tax=Paenibacillus turicensis TaxID=160487 RepID=A0ABS4FR73_9BACL|nr:copper amine oxidase N-terminal domain-containing protein [Paenibacillus turicensis]MBP1904843.1 hypothetical protein [Paenibacillus turicensis]